jgi:hypothetical protein
MAAYKDSSIATGIANDVREAQMAAMPPALTAMFGAAGSSLRHSGETFVAGIKQGAEGLGTLYDINHDMYSSSLPEEKKKLAAEAFTKVGGGIAKSVIGGVFAGHVAGFEMLNAVPNE